MRTAWIVWCVLWAFFWITFGWFFLPVINLFLLAGASWPLGLRT
jgi:hypothetical protein